MSKYQYRINSDGMYSSNFGYSFIAITNPSGSGKKLTLRNLEVNVLNSNGGNATTGVTPCSFYRCTTPIIGEDMSIYATKLDSSATLPTTVKIKRNAQCTGLSVVGKRVEIARKGTTVGTQNRLLFGTPMQIGQDKYSSYYRSAKRASSTVVEPFIVNQNEGYCLITDQSSALIFTQQIRVNITVSINAKTFNWDFVSSNIPGMAVFSIENTGTDVVKILNYSFAELGTTDTATIRMVPIGQLYSGNINDSSKQGVAIQAMNSTYPVLSQSICKVYTDIGFIPSGVPEIAIAPSSTGSPKQMNYLHTKDFWGPLYRIFFPEVCHYKTNGIPDMLGYSYGMKGSDLLVRRSGIVINPGEGIALVSSAETAVGVQAAYSGWGQFNFASQVDVESIYTPILNIDGIIAGSRIKVVRVSDSFVVANSAVPSTTFSLNIDENDIGAQYRVEVRNASSLPYYQPWYSIGTVTTTGLNLTALQQLD